MHSAFRARLLLLTYYVVIRAMRAYSTPPAGDAIPFCDTDATGGDADSFNSFCDSQRDPIHPTPERKTLQTPKLSTFPPDANHAAMTRCRAHARPH